MYIVVITNKLTSDQIRPIVNGHKYSVGLYDNVAQSDYEKF